MMPGVDPKLIVLEFNAAINARDLERLAARMTDDHAFVDTAGGVVRGRDAVERAWRGFFSAFPDYRNAFVALASRGDRVFAVGHSSCSDPALAGPAVWTAEVRDGRVAEWRVYEDTEATRRSLGLRSGGPFDTDPTA